MLVACAPGPKPNQVMGRLPTHSWHGPIGPASYCPSCTNAGLITIDLGSHTQLTTTTCFKHAKAKIGIMQDDAHVQVEAGGTEVIATDGRLEIDDCNPGHIKATLWASFADGGRVEASIDSNMTQATGLE
jgi:hypothetical protein